MEPRPVLEVRAFSSRTRRARALAGRPALFVVGIVGVFAGSAWAGGGVLEINHACATISGCFPGDAPGYPVSITAAAGGRSFVLTSDLLRNGTSANGLTVDLDDVSIDLRGFRVTRSGCLAVAGSACIGAGASAIDAANADGLSIRNGRIGGAGAHGIEAGDRLHVSGVDVRWNRGAGIRAGESARLDAVRALENLGDGFDLGAASTVRRSLSWGNGRNGIATGLNSRVESTILGLSGEAGIATSVATVHGSVAERNGTDPFSVANPLDLSGIRMGTGGMVEATVAVVNPRSGIESFARGNFARNVVIDAGGRGISCLFGCQVDRNVIRGSGDDGIYIGIAGRVANNAVRENDGDGIAGAGEVLVRGNTITGSGDAGILNSVDLGANTCDGATCP